MNKSEYVRSLLLEHPYLISKTLKDPTFNPKVTKGILYKMIPFKTSIEIECTGSLRSARYKKTLCMERIYDILSYDEDYYNYTNQHEYYSLKTFTYNQSGINEHRISIRNYSQAVGLYRILKDMKKHCALNSKSGCHIHVDLTLLLNKITKRHLNILFKSLNEFAIKTDLFNRIDEIFGKYTGEYNHNKKIGPWKANWIRLDQNKNSLEFRTAPMTFDYETIIKWFIECNQIVKKIYHYFCVSYK